MPKSRKRLIALLVPLALATLSNQAVAGQVTVDGTLSPAQTLAGPNYNITQSLGKTVGANLFHSFGLFSLVSVDTANFISSGISNVIARVTGGSLSSIDGRLQASANLYLINPSGITFGPNATLNVSGSFYASTANYLKLADGGRFDVTNPGNSLLTAAAPAAFGFLGPTPAPINVNGSFLLVPEGKTLGLIGGDITINGGAFVGTDTGGAVHLVSVASAGEAKFTSGAFDVSTFPTQGTVSISQGSSIDVAECCGLVSGGGAIYIRGGKLAVDNSTLTAATVEGDSGGIDISVTGDVVVSGGFITAGAGDFFTTSTGRAGNITVVAGGDVFLSNDSFIDASTFGSGRGGDINITAGGDVSLSSSSFIDASTFGSGRGGDINVTASGSFLGDPSQITSFDFDVGAPGSVIITEGTSTAIVGTVATDGTLGPAEVIAGPFYFIDQSLGTTVAGNLFHSFGMFSVGTDETAFFGSTGIANIIARVTGGTVSLIDGTLFADAHLYLINPSGISFGRHASLAVSGSFYASTANYLKLADGGRFDVTAPASSVLTGGSPAAFGFLGPSPAPITVSGSSLLVPEGQTLGLIGGDITINDRAFLATVSSGSVHLVSTASAGEARFGPGAFDVSSFSRLGTISISDGSSIDTSECCGLTSGAGAIYIRSGNLVLDSSVLTAATVTGNSGGLDIAVTGDITVSNGTQMDTSTSGDGQAGGVKIVAGGTLSMSGGSSLKSQTFGSGRGGDIQINAGTLIVDDSSIRSDAFDVGNSGNIAIEAGTLTLRNSAELNSSGSFASGDGGRGGNITISVAGTMSMASSLISSEAFGDGDAGKIQIGAGTLTLANGAEVNSSGAGGGSLGRGGDILITAAGTLSMDNSKITSEAFGAGDAGKIQIGAGTLTLANGAEINSSGAAGGSLGRGGDILITAAGTMSMDSSLISSEALGAGDAGKIQIGAGTLALANGAEINSSGAVGVSLGRGGDILISAGTMSMDSSLISSEAFGAGDAGKIQIGAGTLNLTNLALITSSGKNAGFLGRGGDIVITTTGALITVSGTGTGILSETAGSGPAGNISISSPSIMVDGGFVSASTSGSGSAGSVSITSDTVTLVSGGQVQSKSLAGATGSGGNVNVTAGLLSISGVDAAGNPSGLLTDTAGSGKAGQITAGVGNLVIASGGQVSAATSSVGDGGSVQIAATDSVTITGANSSIVASSTGAGAGGNIAISSPAIVVDAGFVSASTSGSGSAGAVSITSNTVTLVNGGQVSAATSSVGGGGSVKIDASDSVTIAGANSAIAASSTGAGAGGNIAVSAATGVNITGGATIKAESSGTGNAGSININAGGTLLLDGGSIKTSTLHSDGGNITIRARDLIRLNDSSISAEVQGGAGDGGNIFIDPKFFILNHSTITANAFGGNGGNINIIADFLFRSADSSITASSQLGISGSVTISSPIVDLSGILVTLPTSYLNAGALLAERCAPRLAGKASSFVATGRGGMPIEPDSLLPGAVATFDLPAVAAAGNSGRPPVYLAFADFTSCSK